MVSQITALVALFFFCIVEFVSAQADRTHVQALVAYNSPSGKLVDSARFTSSTAFGIGVHWAPSRSYSFGVSGWFTPAEIDPVSPGSPVELRVPSSASIFGMSVNASYRLLKHGITPYICAEAGFGFLTVPDALVGNEHLTPQLGITVAGSLGLLVPVSQSLDADIAARYASTAIGGGLEQINYLVGLRYRLR